MSQAEDVRINAKRQNVANLVIYSRRADVNEHLFDFDPKKLQKSMHGIGLWLIWKEGGQEVIIIIWINGS